VKLSGKKPVVANDTPIRRTKCYAASRAVGDEQAIKGITGPVQLKRVTHEAG